MIASHSQRGQSRLDMPRGRCPASVQGSVMATLDLLAKGISPELKIIQNRQEQWVASPHFFLLDCAESWPPLVSHLETSSTGRC